MRIRGNYTKILFTDKHPARNLGLEGIQKPADVEQHWKKVGVHSRMLINGSLWKDDPILSSYPPSHEYKVIERDHAGERWSF